MNTLKIGDKIPAFECLDNTGNIINSDDLMGKKLIVFFYPRANTCLLYTSPSPRDQLTSRMPSSA